jgi:hypothetical protein
VRNSSHGRARPRRVQIFLDRKKMLEKPATQEAWRGEHRWVNLDNEDQMNEINVIFEGSLSITSKTQGKKLEREGDQPGSVHRA